MRIRVPSYITREKAVAFQRRLAPFVKTESKLPKQISCIVGCDATYVRGRTIAAAVSIDYGDLSVKRIGVVEEATTFPYVPGLLAFREGAPVLHAIRGLGETSYLCMVDGHGVAHPRRFGLACHVGLALDRPTVGVAKNPLYGTVKGGRVLDERGGIVAELMTLPGTKKTVYVSVGHKISLHDAVQVVGRYLTPQGPLPIRLAHEEVTKRKWRNKRLNPAYS